jgi:hypothetical protein
MISLKRCGGDQPRLIGRVGAQGQGLRHASSASAITAPMANIDGIMRELPRNFARGGRAARRDL